MPSVQSTDDATYRERVHARRKAGGGALVLDIVMQDDRAELSQRAAAGDPRSKRLLRTGQEMHAAVASRSGLASWCSTCPTPTRDKPRAAVITAPDVSEDPAQALFLAICTTCGPTLNDVQATALPVLYKVFPRAYAVVPEAGGRG